MKLTSLVLVSMLSALPPPVFAGDEHVDLDNGKPTTIEGALQPVSPALRPLKIGNLILVNRKIQMQTEFVVDDTNTAYMMTTFANGTVRTMRISSKGAVRQPIMYRGWPYILDTKGRLWALDNSLKTNIRTKTPAIVKRLWTHFPYAAATSLGMYGLGWLNIWIHSGATDSDVAQPLTLATAGFVTFYLVDSLITVLRRSHVHLKLGGNFFRYPLGKDVESVVFEPIKNDFEIRFKKLPKDSRGPIFLGDFAPGYTKNTDCIYELTKMVNE